MSPLRVLSLGAGVQSTTLALMAAHGEIKPPDCAIFADTGWEPAAVYRHLVWLEPQLPFPTYRVSAGDIRDGILTRGSQRSGRFAAVPWHIVSPAGDAGMGRRECTAEYKLEPIAKEIRRLLDKPHPAPIPPSAVTLLLGISTDEAHRMRPSRRRYIVNTYPLIEQRMSRWDCLAWLRRRSYPQPPKSACIGCPYTSDAVWRERQANQPEEFAEAVRIDAALRANGGPLHGTEYMHRSLRPLDEVDFTRWQDRNQPDLFGAECEGMCGT